MYRIILFFRLTVILAVCAMLLLACEVIEPASSPTSEVPPAQTPQEQHPSPTQTRLPPTELLDRALEQRSVGDYENSAENLRAYLDVYPNASDDRMARYYLAESFARRGNWTSAVAAFAAFVDDPIEDDLTLPALFWLARGYEEAGDWSNAVATYERYRSSGSPLEPYAALRQAAQYAAMGQTLEAARTYEYVASTDIDRGQRAASFERAIALYRERGDTDKVLALYETLLAFAQVPSYRARLLWDGAVFANDVGQPDRAHAWLHEITRIAPASSFALSAAETLIADGSPLLSNADAARIFYFAETYTVAEQFFDAALAEMQITTVQTDTDETVLDFLRLRALCIRETGRYSESLDVLQAVYQARPDTDTGRQARLDWIQTLGQKVSTLQAAEAYRVYADTYPDDPRTPIALDRAAQLYTRMGDPESAFHTRMELERRYPQNDLSPAPLHAEALYLFHVKRYDEAQHIWLQLADGRTEYFRALGLFWAARCAQQQQQLDEARQWFEQAYEASAVSYYGARAVEELALAVDSASTLGAPLTDADWDVLATWITGWSGKTHADVSGDANDGTPVQDSQDKQDEQDEHAMGQFSDVYSHPVVLRAIGLDEVGLQHEAIAEWNNAREAWDDEPLALLGVARMAYIHEQPYIALKVAEQIQRYAPAEALPVPDALNRLIFPTPYHDLVIDEAGKYELDPRLLYALIRQESLFNPQATSWVGARGLGQVMPATGQTIAQQLGITNFHTDDLYRPAVSIRFGAYYIAQQVAMMQGSVQAGLSAYNGGPGNAQRWAGGTVVSDPDLFTEGIDFDETRTYVKLVYGYYRMYQRLYALP